MAGKGQLLSSFRFTHFLSLILLGGSLFLTPLKATATEGGGQPVLLICPSFQRPPIYRYLPGAKRTLLTPALLKSNGEIEPLRDNQPTTPEEWDHFVKEAKERAALQLATLDPTMVRDKHGVIQMALIVSDHPLTSSCILSSGFLDHFSAIFGQEILIAIPARNRIYVFPKLANHLQEMTGAIRDDYLISPMPVSTEIFELSRNGLRAIGSVATDDE